MFTDDPSDRIYNITFTASIGPDNAGDPFIKVKGGLIGKTLKTFDF